MKKKIFAAALASVMAVACAANVSAVEKTDAISGDHTVTTFFNERTDAVELKDGDSYTFTFNSKSNGTNNWDTFVLAIAGAVGDAYTGADQEVLIIRGDNWGWGGGLSDFVDPNTEGNKLAFETDIDWDNWVAGGQAGYDVSITLSRSGDTLVYDAKIGDYFDKLTATSGKALPESLYVFFTGENVVLSGITTTNNNAQAAPADTQAPEDTQAPADTQAPSAGDTTTTTTDKTSADTGVEGVAVVAGLAIVAAGAVVVAKKRK